jgi:hypothetical protein
MTKKTLSSNMKLIRMMADNAHNNDKDDDYIDDNRDKISLEIQ